MSVVAPLMVGVIVEDTTSSGSNMGWRGGRMAGVGRVNKAQMYMDKEGKTKTNREGKK